MWLGKILPCVMGEGRKGRGKKRLVRPKSSPRDIEAAFALRFSLKPEWLIFLFSLTLGMEFRRQPRPSQGWRLIGDPLLLSLDFKSLPSGWNGEQEINLSTLPHSGKVALFLYKARCGNKIYQWVVLIISPHMDVQPIFTSFGWPKKLQAVNLKWFHTFK